MASAHSVVQGFLKNNEEWANAVIKSDPNFFVRSAEGQKPQVLWIGCSDSRVPGSVVTGSKPGDIFIHRNIANQVHLNDDSVLSVVDFAVGNLGVRHVVVVGHTECGGAKHCLKAAQNPSHESPATPLLRWLEPLTQLARSLDLGSLSHEEGLAKLVKSNVMQQVQNLAKTETIKNVWGRGEDLWVHGLIYDLSTGRFQSNVVVTLERPKN